MPTALRPLVRFLFALILALPHAAQAQTLNIVNGVQTYATLTNTVVALTGKAELRITGTGDPITGCTVNLTSPDSWMLMSNIIPSTVVSTFLSRVRVNGATAVMNTNCPVVEYGQGAMVIPQGTTFIFPHDDSARHSCRKPLNMRSSLDLPCRMGSLNT